MTEQNDDLNEKAEETQEKLDETQEKAANINEKAESLSELTNETLEQHGEKIESNTEAVNEVRRDVDDIRPQVEANTQDLDEIVDRMDEDSEETDTGYLGWKEWGIWERIGGGDPNRGLDRTLKGAGGAGLLYIVAEIGSGALGECGYDPDLFGHIGDMTWLEDCQPADDPGRFDPGDNGTVDPTPQPTDTPVSDFVYGEVYSGDNFVDDCLSEDQVARIEDSIGNAEDLEYTIIDKESSESGYVINIIEDGDRIGYLDDETLRCEVGQ